MKKLLFLFSFFSSFISMAQDRPVDVSKPQNFLKYIKVKDSLISNNSYFNKILQIPDDTIFNKKGIAQIGFNIFSGNGLSWSLVGSFDSTSLSDRINTKVTTGSEAELTGVKAATSAGFTIKSHSGSTVATFGQGGGINANIGNLSIGTAIAFNSKRLADTTDLAPFATTTSVNTALGLKADKNTTLTINGVTQDLSTNRSWTVSGGISGSGAANQVAFWNGTSSQTGSADFTWNNTTRTLILGTPQIGQNSINANGAISTNTSFNIQGQANFTNVGFPTSATRINRGNGMSLFVHDDKSVTIVDAETQTAIPNSIFSTISLTKGTKPFTNMTEAQRLAISVSATDDGLHIYQTNGTKGVYVYKDGIGWVFAY